MISSDEKLISICEFDEENEIRFTKEYLNLMEGTNKARPFAAQLISWWGVENMQTLLDYFGPDDEEMDKYSGIDGAPMDIRTDLTDLMEYKDLALPDLDGEWYRDVLRSKLITLKFPERIIKEYVKAAKKTVTFKY